MALYDEIRKRAGVVVPQVVGVCLVAYFAYHAVQGERGFLAYLRLSQELQQATSIQADLGQQRQVLERRVALLSPDSLDPDLLDERARSLLNYGQEGDLLIFLPQNLQR
tara:strand:+ start:691 stop:1017 length:327 start_codon:yes stop_codon:yes gene_type:complete